MFIRTAPSIDGKRFVVEVAFNDDVAISLPRKQDVLEYADTVLSVVAYAEYEQAVWRQFTSASGLGMKPDLAKQMIVDMRKDRPKLNNQATAPMEIVPGLNADGEAFLVVKVGGLPLGQIDLEQAREHAAGVIEAYVSADLDQAYLRQLRGLIGLEEDRARQVIADLSKYR